MKREIQNVFFGKVIKLSLLGYGRFLIAYVVMCCTEKRENIRDSFGKYAYIHGLLSVSMSP